MPYAQDLDTGEWVEVDAQGNPVASAPKAQGRVFTLPQSPDKAAKDAREAERDARDAQNDAVANQIKALEIELKKRELDKPDTASKEDNAAAQRIANLRALQEQVSRVRELYESGPGATSGPAGLVDFLPTEANRQFDTAGAGLGQIGTAAFKVPGAGTITDFDAAQFMKANQPSASDYDSTIEEKLRTLENRPNTTLVELGEQPAAAPGGSPPNAPQTVASGATRWESLPTRVASTVQSLISAGAGKSTVDAALKTAGFPPVPFRDWNAIKTWQTKNPGKAYTGTVQQEVPLSMLQQAAGSTLGAGVANYADAATAGISTAIAGDRGRGALDAMNATNPNASAVGSILGGVTGAGAAELALAARAPAALARYAPRIGDALYGGVAGATSAQDGEGLTGAALGAGAGVAGGMLGEGAMRAAGSVFRGVQNPAARYLRDQGIPLTVGQTVGDSGTIGAGVKKMEDAATSIPFIGNMIEARRMEGLRGFNDAAFQRAGAPGATITARGAEGMQQVRQSVGDAYDNALGPVQIDANDPQFFADLVALQQRVGAIPNVNGAQDAANAGLRSRIDGAIDPGTDQISGRGFQEAYRGLARTGRERANGDYGYEIGQAMRGGQDALGEALERQNPGAFDGFLEANAANRRANVLADALKNGANQGEELITPAQLNRADVGSTSRLEGKINSASGNRPFYDLATAGQQVLPSKLPDSGTWTRALTGIGLTGGLGGAGAYAGGGEGAATGAGMGLGATLALALGGTRGAQNVAVRGLLDRPDVAITIGEELRRRAALGGAGGAGILAQIVGGQ